MGSLGQLPKEYNKAVHGPYDPAVFYGKKDVPLGQVEYIIPTYSIILFLGEASGAACMVW